MSRVGYDDQLGQNKTVLNLLFLSHECVLFVPVLVLVKFNEYVSSTMPQSEASSRSNTESSIQSILFLLETQ